MAKETKEELYKGFSELMRGDAFGWGPELQKGDGAMEDLLEKGVLLGRDGKRIPGKSGRSEEKLKRVIAKCIQDGKAVYLYKKGEAYPREVRYNPETKRFSVGEPVNQVELHKVPKPSAFKRYYLNLFSLMFRGKSLQSIRDWKHYEHQREAFDNAMAEKRVNRRKRYDPILNGKGEAEPEKQSASAQPAAEAGEKPKAPEQSELSELKAMVEALTQQFGVLQEELKLQQAENAALKKTLEGQQTEVKPHTLPENGHDKIESPSLDGKEAVGQEEAKKDFFQKTEVPAAEQKMDLDAVVKEPVPETKPVQPAVDKKQPEPKTEVGKPQIKNNVKLGVKMKEGTDPLSQIAAEERAKEAEFGQMMELLKTQEKGKLTQNLEKNVRSLYVSAERAKQQLEIDCRAGKRFAGGDAVKQIVAYNNVKNQIESGRLSDTLREMLEAANGAQLVTEMSGVSNEMKYAANIAHEPSYFQKNFLNQSKLDEITNSSDKKLHGFVSEHFKDGKALQQALNQPMHQFPSVSQPGAVKDQIPVVVGP